MKVGEIYTTERIVMGGTGYFYAPVRLMGEVALVGSEVVYQENDKYGAPMIQRFTFKFLRPGKAEIQFARLCNSNTKMTLYENILPFEVEESTDNGFNLMAAPGGWSPFEALKEEDSKVFDKAMEGLKGVKYVPEKVSIQIVNGKKYSFFCYGEPEIQGERRRFPAIITVYAAPHEEPKRISIEHVLL